MIKFDFDNKIEFEKMWEIISGCIDMYVRYIDYLQDRRTPHLSVEEFFKNYNRDLYDTYMYYESFAEHIRRLNDEIFPLTEEVRSRVQDVQDETRVASNTNSTHELTWTETATYTTTAT